EGVGSKAAALVDLSTVAGNKISNPPWVKFQSAGWVNFPSAPTAMLPKLVQAFGTPQSTRATHADAEALARYVLAGGRVEDSI
ncbi:hypothetical protein ACIUY0_32645, partial [Pseudomonas aeruginosa]